MIKIRIKVSMLLNRLKTLWKLSKMEIDETSSPQNIQLRKPIEESTIIISHKKMAMIVSSNDDLVDFPEES